MTSNDKTQRACEVFGYIFKGCTISLLVYVALTQGLSMPEGHIAPLIISGTIGYTWGQGWYDESVKEIKKREGK